MSGDVPLTPELVGPPVVLPRALSRGGAFPSLIDRCVTASCLTPLPAVWRRLAGGSPDAVAGWALGGQLGAWSSSPCPFCPHLMATKSGSLVEFKSLLPHDIPQVRGVGPEAWACLPGQGLRYLEHLCLVLEQMARLQQLHLQLQTQRLPGVSEPCGGGGGGG